MGGDKLEISPYIILIRPNREPDFKHKDWVFWFEEMIEGFSTNDNRLISLRYNETLKIMQYKCKTTNHEWAKWGKTLDEAYLQWIVEKELLR